MNERDSETIAGLLDEMGFCEGSEADTADIAIINTCSVRENADNRFFGALGRLKKAKEARPDFIVGVCGCMMQQQHVVDKLKEKYPWVDLVFGTHNLHELPKLLSSVISEKRKRIEVLEESCGTVEGLPAKRLHAFKAFVNIMFGCDNFCTYCIVPYTRGRERSRQPENIISEVRSLAESGVKEVTLLGQNVNSYRGAEKIGFTELIYMLNEIDGIERIRFTTSHPKDLSDGLIDAFSECGKLCGHIHLPVQSGSSRILERMNRKYTKDDYLELSEKLRRSRRGISITTDIIVGFPGETEEDFEETLDVVRKVEFDSAFTFLYSIRRGTPAEKYEGQVPEETKHERFGRLICLLNGISAKKNKAYEGCTEKVLVEGRSKTNKDVYAGRTDSFKLVNFISGADYTGEITDVLITGSKTFSLFGEKTT
ncbi:MAG: tRNA (N6-isopentenyl adenosine(37)-C2)-methylthiotransferase MiaB [Clostridiales bacterium]|nr:tRNA (N6-isopentenyl adenosine(37)-C2)-methylthiotransferase MiaB [Clostridiales bacterium]